MKVLCLTHSSRPFFEARCRLNALLTRFSADRFASMPPYESLPGVDDAVPFYGSLSLWAIEEADGRPASLRFLHSYEPDYKVQTALFLGDQLVVCGSKGLELLDADFKVVRTITDPWLVGSHTVHADADGHLWVTSAPANAALRIRLSDGAVVERLVMPERYGRGYPLTPEDDLHRHFIPTDLQPTHINCAVPLGDGLLVTLLAPGAVGLFDARRRYTEIVRGYYGCHGGRIHPETGELVLSDSPAGIVWFFDMSTGRPVRRVGVSSAWLHDAEPLGRNVLVATLGDANTVQLVDERNGEVLFEQNCDRWGCSVMFANVYEVSPAWQEALEARAPRTFVQVPAPPSPTAPNLLAETVSGWASGAVEPATGSLRIRGRRPVQYDYLHTFPSVRLTPGRHLFSVRATCHRGEASIGLLDLEDNTWIGQLTLDDTVTSSSTEFEIDKPATALPVIAANNANGPKPVDLDVDGLYLGLLEPAPASDVTPEAPQSGPDLLPYNMATWLAGTPAKTARASLRLTSEQPVQFEYLLQSHVLSLTPGTYRLAADVSFRRGVASIGLVDDTRDAWIVQLGTSELLARRPVELTITEPSEVRLVVAGNNSEGPAVVDIEFHGIRLHQVEPDTTGHVAAEPAG
jgi:hypothetical protein